jgi:hypothetical protein
MKPWLATMLFGNIEDTTICGAKVETLLGHFGDQNDIQDVSIKIVWNYLLFQITKKNTDITRRQPAKKRLGRGKQF